MKVKSFKELGELFSEKTESWKENLKRLGHTEETFQRLPEWLKTDIKFNHAKKQKK